VRQFSCNIKALQENLCPTSGTDALALFSTRGRTWDPNGADSSTDPGPDFSARRSCPTCGRGDHRRFSRPPGSPFQGRLHDVTDEETVEPLAFNLQWHYALDLPGESDEGKYVCLRTLWTMRQLLAEKKLDQLLFDSVTKKLASVFSVDTSKQRLDSVHITSNMRRLGRIGIFVRVITGFLTNLKRREPELFATLDPSFGERYLSPKGQTVFSMVKPSESDRTLSQMTEDLFVLVRRFEKGRKRFPR